jgi:hypothetical protein
VRGSPDFLKAAGIFPCRFSFFRIFIHQVSNKMKQRILVSLCLIISHFFSAYAQNRKIQFVHNSVDSALDTVDVYLNNSLLYDDLIFRHATPFLEFTSWDGNSIERIHVLTNGSSDTLFSFLNWNLPPADGLYQVVMNGVYFSGEFPGTQFIRFDVSAETELIASSNEQFKLRFHHGVDDGPALDIGESSTAFPDIWAENIAYGDFSQYIERNDSIYRVGIFSDDILVLNYAGYFNDENYLGKASTLILSGLAGPEFIETELMVSLYQINSEGGPFIELFPATVLDTAIVQFINASPSSDLETVDVYLNNEMWLDDFQTLHATPFLKIPANRNISLAVCSAQSTSSNNPLFTSFFNLPISTQIGILAGQTSSVSEPVRPLQLVWRDNARQQALESDEVDVLFFNASIDLNSCNIRAFEPVNSTLCANLNWGEFSNSGYISIPPFSYQFNILDNLSSDTLSSIRFDASALSGNAMVFLITGALNPAQNPDGFPLGAYYSTESGGMLLPCSITTDLENSQKYSGFELFPNPANEVLRIHNESVKPSPVAVELRDAMGRLIYATQYTNASFEIRVSDFANGLYYLRLHDLENSAVLPVLIAH